MLYLISILFSLLIAIPAGAAVTFTNGFYSSDFENCVAGATTAGYSCDGIVIEDNYEANGEYSRVRTINPDADGSSGQVWSVYYVGNSRNDLSTPPKVRFDPGVTEFWLRYYYRLPDGQIIGDLGEHKILFLYTNTSVSAVVDFPSQGNNTSLTMQGTMESSDFYFVPDSGTVWGTIFGSASTPSDGSWHYYEYHFSLGTQGSNNGVYEMWIDGTRYAYKNDIDWYNGGSASVTGFGSIDLVSNHNVWTLSGANPHDLDEVAIALPTYTGFVQDSNGRDMIGPIGDETLTPIFSESFEDESWASRGWYDNTSAVVTSSNCYSGNCLQYTWAQGEQLPVGGEAMRHAITTDGEMFVRMYLKFDTNWQGSQQTYHPHMFYFPSNLDDAYTGMSTTYLNTYIEVLTDIGSPYEIRPQLSFQDELRVNTSYGTPPVSIVSQTEDRSTFYCNGWATNQDQPTEPDCYPHSGNYFSAGYWRNESVDISKNTWHKIEVYYKMNTVSGNIGQPDGIMKQWIDDVLVQNLSHMLWRTNTYPTITWAYIVLSPYIGDGSPITQSVWVDELQIYSTNQVEETSAPPAKPTKVIFIE